LKDDVINEEIHKESSCHADPMEGLKTSLLILPEVKETHWDKTFNGMEEWIVSLECRTLPK